MRTARRIASSVSNFSLHLRRLSVMILPPRAPTEQTALTNPRVGPIVTHADELSPPGLEFIGHCTRSAGTIKPDLLGRSRRSSERPPKGASANSVPVARKGEMRDTHEDSQRKGAVA